MISETGAAVPLVDVEPEPTTVDDIFHDNNQYQTASLLSAEIEEGNTEYKYKLTELNEEQFMHRVTQLNWRLNEGNDVAIYEIGVEDDGNPLGITREEMRESIDNLKKMAKAVGCSLKIHKVLQGSEGLIAEVVMKRIQRANVSPTQVYLALAGDFECGKSTLIGVLSTGRHDNGHGLARMQVFQHNHEVCSGRTSSISQHNLYYNSDGQLLNTLEVEASKSNLLRSRTEMELADASSRIITFIDLAGHSKYLKTTLHGLTARAPDHCLLCISAKRGIQSMTTEHLGVAFALKLPLALAITKCDLLTDSQLEIIVNNLVRMLSTSKRTFRLITESDQLLQSIPTSFASTSSLCSTDLNNSTIVPIFLTSSVTGRGLHLLRQYFFMLSNRSSYLKLINSQSPNIRSRSQQGAESISTYSLSRVIGSFKFSNKTADAAIISIMAKPPRKKCVRRNLDSNKSTSSSTEPKTRQQLNSSSPDSRAYGNKYGKTKTNKSNSDQTNGSSRPRSPTSALLSLGSTSGDDSKSLHVNLPDFNCFSNSAHLSITNSIANPDIVFLTTVQMGDIRNNGVYHFGPISAKGEFVKVKIKSIRVNNIPVMSACTGQTATVMLSKLSNNLKEPPKLSVDRLNENNTATTSPNLLKPKPFIAPKILVAENNMSNDYSVSFQDLIAPSLSPNRVQSPDNKLLSSIPVSSVDGPLYGSMGTFKDSSSSISYSNLSPEDLINRSYNDSPVINSDELLLPTLSPELNQPSIHSNILSETFQQINALSPPSLRRSRSSTMPTLPFYKNSETASEPTIFSNQSCDDQVLKKSASLIQFDDDIKSNFSDDATWNSFIRRGCQGLVLISVESGEIPVAHWEFEAELLVLNHPSKIKINYEPVVHIGCIKQSARIISMTAIPSVDPPSEIGLQLSSTIGSNQQLFELVNGCKAICRFRFLYYPEYITSGSTMLIREGRTRGVGHVVKPLPNILALPNTSSGQSVSR